MDGPPPGLDVYKLSKQNLRWRWEGNLQSQEPEATQKGKRGQSNSTQTESSSIADTWIVQDRAKGRRMGSVEVERRLSISILLTALMAICLRG